MNEFTDFRPSTGMDMASIQSQGYGMVQYGPTDDKLIVGFYRKSVLNGARSREMGSPQYDSRDFVKIQHPGETLNVVDRPVNEGDKQRWPQRWHQYQAGVTQIPDGIPLNQLFPDRPHIVDTMRGYNIHTVEQLANLSASAIDKVGMGAMDWVNGAKRYMERVEKGVSHHQFEKALADKDTEIKQLRRELDTLAAMVRQQTKPEAPQWAARSVVQPPVDFQEQQINATHQSNEPFTPEPAQFVHDLSGEVQTPPKRGPGRPRKNQEH